MLCTMRSRSRWNSERYAGGGSGKRRPRERGGSALCVVTGAIDDSLLPAVAALRHQFQRVVVISITTSAVTVPNFPGVTVLSATDAEGLTAAWNVAVLR